MKKLIIFSILILCSLVSFPQANKTELKQKLANITETWGYPGMETIIFTHKTEYTYDTRGKLSSEWVYNWDEGKSEWYGTNKDVYTRDARGNITIIVELFVSKAYSTVYRNNNQYEYSYDENGNRLSINHSLWDGNKWINYLKGDLTYDGKNELTKRIDSKWDEVNGKWVIYWGSILHFDSKENLVRLVSLKWDSTLNRLDSLDKTEGTFDASNNPINQFHFKWDTKQNKWLNFRKVDYAYNGKGNRDYYIIWDWDTIKNNYIESYKTEMLYDSKDNLILETYLKWDTITNSWMINGKYEYLYDVNFKSDKLVMPFDYFLKNKSKILQRKGYGWDEKSSSWFNNSNTTYNYSNFVTISPNDDGLLVFPNPASEKVFIEVENHPGKLEINLYDITGKLVIKDFMDGSGSMNTENLTEGLYIMQLFEDKRVLGVRKLLISR